MGSFHDYMKFFVEAVDMVLPHFPITKSAFLMSKLFPRSSEVWYSWRYGARKRLLLYPWRPPLTPRVRGITHPNKNALIWLHLFLCPSWFALHCFVANGRKRPLWKTILAPYGGAYLACTSRDLGYVF